MSWKVANIRLEIDEPEQVLPEKLATRIGIARDEIASYRILRKSLDARSHDDLHFVYAAEVQIASDGALHPASAAGVERFVPESFDWPPAGSEPLEHRPAIIGAGPAGLFAGYMLALGGYRPLILERGRDVKDRVADVRRFDGGGLLDPESNYLFGEGGAGTFSDGKLTSRNTGPDVVRVLEILADCHGKPSILYEAKPHLGSNRLPLIVRTLRRKFESLGGEIQFSCRVEDLDVADGRLKGLMTSSGYVPADLAVLAIGHSARDTYGMLLRRGVPLEQKAFQLGVRIEQPQESINVARHGAFSEHPTLGAAEYNLNVKAGGRDLFTFCMCPGGIIMPSVSEPGYFGTNGMSHSLRDTPFANSGVVVTVGPDDLGSRHPLAGVHFQQRAERLAYLAGGRTYHAPVQRAEDFLAGRASRGKIRTSYERGTIPTDLGLILPPLVMEALERGIKVMDRKLRGAFLRDAVLTGPESRGSSPVRITRDDSTRESPAVRGLYPCGEGAGYAGGIVSAAVDGLRTARAIVARHASARR
jgi:uncharacterized protein